MTVMTETPPPASADWAASVRHGLLALTAGLGVFLLWSTTARLDSAVLAPGVVSVETNRKTVQHLEGGIVREILVHDGDHVEPGQILLRLDQTRAASMRALYSSQLAILLAQEARLAAERDSATSLTFPHDVEEQANNAIVARAIADQRQEFSVKRDTLIRGIETVDAQIAQAQQDLQQSETDNRTANETLANVETELAGVQELFKKNLVALPRLSALQREKLRLEGVIANSASGGVKLKERIQELTLKRTQVTEDYKQDAATRLVEVRKSLNELRQQFIVASDAQQRVDVRAPTGGMVQQMRIFTVGGVVRPGDAILDIVPASDTLIVRARVSPLDADRIYEGMNAEVRFPSFRYLGRGIIQGRVHAVSRDRLVDDATREPYFDAQIQLDRASVPQDIATKLTAGMPAEVIVPTGARTVFAYLTTPLADRFNSSMRER